MPEEFNIEKLKSENPEIFKVFSSELLEFILSEQTSSKINEICLENKVGGKEKIEKIAYRVTLALLGQVPKENLTEIFEKGVPLNRETAKKISTAIEKRVFSKIPNNKKGPEEPSHEDIGSHLSPIEKWGEKETEKPLQKDTYREPVE